MRGVLFLRALLHQVFRVEAIKLRQDEAAVLADEDVVKVDFTAAVFRSLAKNKIPMHCALVAVWRVVVGATRCKVD